MITFGNVRLVALLVILALLSGCGGAEERKAKYKERAMSYYDAGTYKKAKVEFNNVLQIDPKDADSWYYVGVINEEEGELRRAFRNYARAAELDPSNTEAHRKLARFYMAIGDMERTKEELDMVFEKALDDPEARVIKAAMLWNQGNAEEATVLVKGVLKDEPGNTPATFLLVSIHRQKQEFNKIVELLEISIESDTEGDVRLQLMLADAHVRMSNHDKAAMVLEGVVSKYPDNMEYRTILASYYARLDRLDESEKVLVDAVALNPTAPERHLLLAEFYLQRRGIEKAEEYLSKVLRIHTDLTELRFGLARLYEVSDRISDAEKIYTDIEIEYSGKPEEIKAKSKIADIRIKQQRYTEATDLVDTVLAENPSDTLALIIKGKLELNERRHQEAISYLRIALKDDPESLEVLLLLGMAHSVSGKHELAEDSLRKAVAFHPENVGARLRLGRLLFSRKDLEGAEQQVEFVLRTDPEHFAALLVKTDILAVQQDTEGLRKTLNRIKEIAPDKADGYFRMGRFHLANREYDLALKEFELAYQKANEAPSMLAEIVRTEFSMGNESGALSRLADVLKKDPKHRSAHLLLANIYEQKRDLAAAEKEYVAQVEVAPDLYSSYTTLARARMRMGDYAGAEKAFLDGLNRLPKDTVLRMAFANFFEGQGKFNEATAQYEDVLRLDPDNIVSINNLVALLTDHKGDPASLRRAKRLSAPLLKMRQPILLDTVGWVHYKLGEYGEAISILSRVVEDEPENPIYQYHLGMAYFGNGEQDQAKTHLSKAVDAAAKFPGKDEARQTLEQLN